MTDPDLDVLALLKQAVLTVCGRELPEGLTRDLPISDLDLDSVAMLSTIGWLEDRLHVRIMGPELGSVHTVGELVDLVQQKVDSSRA